MGSKEDPYEVLLSKDEMEDDFDDDDEDDLDDLLEEEEDAD